MAAYYTVKRGRVVDLRARRLWTQDALAKAAGVAKQTITRMETGSHTPSFDTIKKVAAALDVGPDALIDYHVSGAAESASEVPSEPGLTEENEAGLEAARRRKEELDEEKLREGNASGTGDRAP
ncbi:helix-turn-helix transcriptional regulator [Rubrobacter marinus]|uniref:helix-turn-helix transcriptional regulator n=1 Tax=Rubrobacter marinus TaxID=2653852 RepID=UPI00140C57B4|nr:helix-turn-helix transcriptional regulator [Rubrobacter marinus]